MVGLQAEVGIAGDSASINLPALLEKLRQPLHPDEQPKPPLPLLNSANSVGSANYADIGPITHNVRPYSPNWNDYKQYLFDQQKNLEKNNAPSKLKRSNFVDEWDRSYLPNQRERSNVDDKWDRSNLSNQREQISSQEMKTLLDWIHEENRKDLLRQ